MKFGLIFLAAGLLAGAAETGGPLVVTARLSGTIDPATSDYLKSAIRRAEAAQAEILVVELDTPGGLVSSVREMAQAIDQSSVPVVVYVTPSGAAATSAGALLALASHFSAMAPGTNIGAAHPVASGGEDIKGAMAEKALNDTVAFARSQAELRHRPPDLAEAVVARSQSFTAEDARSRGLVNALASSREELLAKLDHASLEAGPPGARQIHVLRTAGARIETFGMSAGQSLLHLLANPNLASMLMTLGMLLIYVEISSPGIGIAGILGAISLLVAFMSFQLLPIRTGGLVLLLLGVALLIAEPFVTAHGAIAAGGILSFVLGLLWIVDPTATTLTIRTEVWMGAAAALGFFVFLIAWAASRTRSLSQAALAKIGGGSLQGLTGYLGTVQSVSGDGRRGVALFRGETWEFEAALPVTIGTQVRPLGVEGLRVRVEPA